MRVPTRKSENKKKPEQDPYITQAKYDKLKADLDRMMRKRPALAKEVARLAELGDFSENAEYQMAKGKLRGLNHRMMVIEETLKHSQIIQSGQKTDKVRLGHTVTVEVNGNKKTLQILGSTETNPGAGVISQNSPIGEALLGETVGETVEVKLANNKTIQYKIIKIEV
jgi:transcription elongation factor GreA